MTLRERIKSWEKCIYALVLTVMLCTVLIMLIMIFIAQVTYIPPKEIVDSIDCFDTILFRYHGSPEEFYTFLEHEFGVPGFCKARKECVFNAYSKLISENNDRCKKTSSNGKYECNPRLQGEMSLDRIYKELSPQFDWSEEEAKKYAKMEWELDDRFLFVITANVKHMNPRVTKVVSDTFYRSKDIIQLLDNRNIPYKEAVVTGYSKHVTSVWNDPRLINVRTHLGDNVWSDVVGPAVKAGIKGIYSSISKRTHMETLIKQKGYVQLSNWMRFLRLSQNPYIPGTDRENRYMLWNEQIEYNIPLMIWSCYKIHNLCRQKRVNRLCFATRDTCHMKLFFDRMFVNEGYETRVFHTSRIVLQDPPDIYISYATECLLQSDEKNTLFVDLNGTGRSIRAFINKHITPQYKKGVHGNIYTFFSVWHTGSNYLTAEPILPDGFLFRLDVTFATVRECFLHAAKIEMLNYDTKGMLIGWDKGNAVDSLSLYGSPKREEPKYNVGYIEIYHQAIHTALQYLFYPDNGPYERGIPYERDSIVSVIIKRYVDHGRLPQLVSHDEGFIHFFKRGRKLKREG